MEEEFKKQSIKIINHKREKDSLQAIIDNLKKQNDYLNNIQKVS